MFCILGAVGGSAPAFAATSEGPAVTVAEAAEPDPSQPDPPAENPSTENPSTENPSTDGPSAEDPTDGLEREPTSSPSPTPTPAVPTPGLAPTTITISPEGFSPTGFATAGGTAQAGSRVVVTADGVEICVATAADDGTFDCGSVRLPDGDDIEVVATETRSEPGAAAPEPATARIDVLRPPVVDGARTLLTTGLISGTGRPGATVTVWVDGTADASCTAIPVPVSTYWSCNLSMASGTYAVRAQQSDAAIGDGSASGYSSVQTVTVDRDAPAAAVITSPGPGATIAGPAGSGPSITVSGTGESGAAVDLYLDDVPACAASVSDGRWSCEVGGLDRGAHSLQAIMRDAAGNYAAPSSPVGIIVAISTPPSPSAGPTPTSPIAPADPGTPAPPPGGEQTVPGDGNPAVPPPAVGGTPPWHDSWSSPTGFGGGIRSLVDSVSTGNWVASPLIALLFVALIAIPLRLLASALRGRIRLPRFTGRNRSRRSSIHAATDVPSTSSPLTRGVISVAAAAALILASVGIAGEVRYLRLYLAIAVGLAVLNIVGAVVATRLGARVSGIRTTVRFLPLMLAAAAVTAVVSRLTEIEPPIITGVLVGAGFAAGTAVRRRAAVSIAEVGAVALLGLLGWMLLGAVSPASGFWAVVANETLATVCLAGLGSALLLVLPIASLPGRVILEWSPAAWVVTTLAVSTIAAGVVFGGVLVEFALMPWVIAAACFAAISVAVWAYVRFVEPARA